MLGVGNWMVVGKTMYLVLENPTVTHHCDVMAQVRLEDRQVRKARS